ncbi:MAG TPA: hypothetical protein VMQ17_20700 [Candidatus Sulfotelmatobacter sp.]|nr:hypothetical protein [Candidatus Sulfotelmatobacter sp.]
MNNLPAFGELSQDDSAAVDESASIVEMKGDNCNVPGNLNLEAPRLQVQVWSFSSSGTNLLDTCRKLRSYSDRPSARWGTARG